MTPKQVKEQLDRELQIAEVIHNLTDYWEKHPYLRLCQIVTNAWHIHPDYKRNPEPDIQDIFYFTDSKFLDGLRLLDEDEPKYQGPTQK
jgi:hypothetical protein